MTHETLHIGQSSTPPDMTALDVKHHEQRPLLGADWTVAVIGSSHYVGAPALGFHELCSCEPVEWPGVTEVPLAVGTERRVSAAAGSVAAETLIEGHQLSSFPGPEAADIAYQFGRDAYTTVDLSGQGYQTYHTYPEYDLALYTETTITTTQRTHEPELQR